MEPLFAVWGVVVAGGGAAFLFYKSKQRERRRAVWKAIAEERGGTLVVPSLFGSGRERMEVPYGRVVLLLETYNDGGNSNNEEGIRCTARFANGGGPECHVYREGLLASIGKALGNQDIDLGIDANFDHHYMVKGTQPSALRRWWTEETSALMLRHFSSARLFSSGKMVELQARGTHFLPEKLHAALDLIGVLANRDIYGADAMREVAGPGLTFSRGGVPKAEVSSPAKARLFPAEDGNAIITVAELDARVEQEELTVAVDDSGKLDAEARRRLPHRTIDALADVGGGVLMIIDGAARFEWREVVTSADRLRAGLAALAGLVEGAEGGVYR